MKQEIENKKRELDEKEKELAEKDKTSYETNKAKIEELNSQLINQMNGFNRNDAREKVNDVSYKMQDPTKATDADGVVKAGEELLNNNVFTNQRIKELREQLSGAVNGTKGIFKTGGENLDGNSWDRIKKIGPELIIEIEKVQADSKDKYRELVKLDDGTGALLDEIKRLKGEKEALESQRELVTKAENKETKAKEEYEKAKKKFDDAIAWEAWVEADQEGKGLENDKNKAETTKTKAEKEKTDAEAADKKFKEEAEKAYNDASEAYKKMKEEANKAKEALSKPPDPAAVKKIKDKIGKDLLAIKKSLEKYSCIKKVKERLDKLDKQLTKFGTGGSTSIASDMEDPFVSLRELPSLDDLDGDTPTDEVPDDIVKNTSEVKIFNVKPGQWLSTGIQLKKGQNFSITAKGTVKREKDRTWGPDGYYFIGFMAYTLKALVGDKLFEIGSDGSGTAPVDGVLKLGITSTYEKINPGDSKLQGSFVATVTIEGK